jgi:hypothetical protein
MAAPVAFLGSVVWQFPPKAEIATLRACMRQRNQLSEYATAIIRHVKGAQGDSAHLFYNAIRHGITYWDQVAAVCCERHRQRVMSSL